MPKISDYVEAKKEYKSVKYYPFNNEPGDPFVLTSDPWYYLRAWLKKKIIEKKKFSSEKNRITKALYFAELAESFQKSADLTVLPTKGTLSYYSVLNLVKCYLLTCGYELEKNMEYHGLSLPSKENIRLIVSNEASDNGINIFHEFSKIIGSPVTPKSTITLDEMISEIVEVHEMSFNLGKLTTNRRKFLPVEVRILTNTPKFNKLIYEVAFEKKNANLMHTEKFKSGSLRVHLEKQEDDPSRKHWTIYRSKMKLNYTSKSEISWKKNYRIICSEIENLNISPILSRSGYRYYLNLEPAKYKPQVYFFALMYYIGAVARYRPSLNELILEGDYTAILNEVMTTSPKQFLYYLVSKITNKVCAVPMAKID